MHTKLLLVRHGATAANLENPPRLQGLSHNPPLALHGKRQAELTRDFLAIRQLQACYSSPMRRAVETASILVAPHDIPVQTNDLFEECDVGRWEGKSWQQIEQEEPENFQAFMKDPGSFGYPDGENFASVLHRVRTGMDEIIAKHIGEYILVVAHHIVLRTYLADAMGLPVSQARKVSLQNCSISMVHINAGKPLVHTLNSTFHLQSAAA